MNTVDTDSVTLAIAKSDLSNVHPWLSILTTRQTKVHRTFGLPNN